MGPSVSSFSSVLPVLLALLLSLIDHQVMSLGIGITLPPLFPAPTAPSCAPIQAADVDRIQFVENIEYLQGEYLSCGAFGKGLDSICPGLSKGGPPPIGCRKAFLDDNPVAARIIQEMVYEQCGHIKAINRTVGGIPRPLLNLGRINFGLLFDLVFKRPLIPPFNPYANSLNFLIVAYVFPSYSQTAYVGAIPNLATNSPSLILASKLAPIKAGQAAIIRSLLYQNATQLVPPYNITVREFTKAIAQTVNDLGKCGIKDEGILLANTTLGAENRTTTNVLAADYSSLSYTRTEPELLRIVYGTGKERLPGAFFPKGANGKIARSFLLL